MGGEASEWAKFAVFQFRSFVAGSPPGIPGSTNALRVHRMGDAADGVAPAYRDEMDTSWVPSATR